MLGGEDGGDNGKHRLPGEGLVGAGGGRRCAAFEAESPSPFGMGWSNPRFSQRGKLGPLIHFVITLTEFLKLGAV